MIITVRGEHELKLTPERGTVHLQLSSESASREASMQALQQALREVVADVDALKAADPSPVTWSSVDAPTTSSWRPWNDKGDQLPLRYSTRARVQVRFSDFRELSAWVVAWGERQFVNVSWVEWTLTDETRDSRRDEVLTAAVAQARSRAQVIANAAGGGEVVALEVADPGLLGGQGETQPLGAPMMARAAAAPGGAAQAIELSPQEIVLSAEVEAKFQA